MRPSKKSIESVLRKAEDEFNLRHNVLAEIYDAESRVVFRGRRRGISKDLRKIIQNAFREEKEVEN